MNIDQVMQLQTVGRLTLTLTERAICHHCSVLSPCIHMSFWNCFKCYRFQKVLIEVNRYGCSSFNNEVNEWLFLNLRASYLPLVCPFILLLDRKRELTEDKILPSTSQHYSLSCVNVNCHTLMSMCLHHNNELSNRMSIKLPSSPKSQLWLLEGDLIQQWGSLERKVAGHPFNHAVSSKLTCNFVCYEGRSGGDSDIARILKITAWG